MKRAVALMMMLAGSLTYAQREMTPPQPQYDRLFAEEAPGVFFFPVNFVGDTPERSRIEVLYRIDVRFFVPVRATGAATTDPFVRRGEILVELVNEAGISTARDIRRVEIGEKDTDVIPEAKVWHEGVASFSVEPGEYTIVFEVDDLESSRQFLDRKQKIRAEAFKGDGVLTSTPLFVLPQSDTHTFVPVNIGGDMLFGKGARLFVQVYAPKLTNAPVRVEYSIATQRYFLQESRVVATDTIEALQSLPHPSPIRLAGTPTAYMLAPFDTNQSVQAFLIPLKAEKLPLRPLTLKLQITQNALKVPIEREFTMVWPDMPMSLRDVDFALEALRHITRPEELDSLKSGTQNTRLKHLEEFWKAKDRTPDTEYNEVMVEYYRRVDYTMRAFSSIRGGDGYRTDRGRIYILHGPPTKTERMLDPQAGYQEIWTYEKLGKRFVFLDQTKNGNYILIASQNI